MLGGAKDFWTNFHKLAQTMFVRQTFTKMMKTFSFGGHKKCTMFSVRRPK